MTNRKEPQMCDVTENRFRAVLMFLRIGGVPINTKNASVLHSTYNALMAINAYALYIAIYMEIILNNDDLKSFMKTFRVLNSSTFLYWLHLNLRYIKQRVLA
jgi:CRISPR/Cas system-associated protein endoribonuclease Cas2